LRRRDNNANNTLESDPFITLAARIAVGAIFFLSGRTKVEGFLTVSDSAYTLFGEDYKVPLLPAACSFAHQSLSTPWVPPMRMMSSARSGSGLNSRAMPRV
jgi:putative oxidoreductase